MHRCHSDSFVPVVVAHTSSPSTSEARVRGQEFEGQSPLHNKFGTSQEDMKSCHKTKQNQLQVFQLLTLTSGSSSVWVPLQLNHFADESRESMCEFP